ncbi:MAG TPA: hypothetical protein VG405_00375 [Solirubrobacteraceae bacterium]|nr:hypothetical protein [Solirubrobacteraceae bacterium]
MNEPDHPLTSPAGGIAVRRLGLHPVLAPGDPAEPYALIWDVTFTGGFPVNATTRRASRIVYLLPSRVRDPLMSATSRLWLGLRKPSEHVIAKTVAGVFALEWIADRYGAAVVVTKRNLLSVIGSWLRLGFVPYAGVSDPVMLTGHPAVRREYVESLDLAPVDPGAPILERVTFHVALLAAHLDRTTAAHPEWTVVSHEEFAAASETAFRQLFDRLGLVWSVRVAERLKATNAPGTGTTTQRTAGQLHDSWRRDLDSAQLARVQSVLAQFGDGFPSITEAMRAGGQPAPS